MVRRLEMLTPFVGASTAWPFTSTVLQVILVPSSRTKVEVVLKSHSELPSAPWSTCGSPQMRVVEPSHRSFSVQVAPF